MPEPISQQEFEELKQRQHDEDLKSVYEALNSVRFSSLRLGDEIKNLYCDLHDHVVQDILKQKEILLRGEH